MTARLSDTTTEHYSFCVGYLGAYGVLEVRMCQSPISVDRWIEGKCPTCGAWVRLDPLHNYGLILHGLAPLASGEATCAW